MKRLGSTAAALAALVWLFISGLGYLLVPFYGFRVDMAGEPRIQTLAGDLAVRDGDRIVRMNGRPLTRPEDLNEILQEAAPRTPLTIEVERAGQPLQLVQPPVPHSRRVLAGLATSILAGLVLLAVGLTVRLRRSGKPATLFFLFCVSVALLMGGIPDGFGTPLLRSVATKLLIAALVLCGAFLLHFFLVFPQPHRVLRRFPRLERLLYLPPVAFLLVVYAANAIPRAAQEALLTREDLPARLLVALLRGVAVGSLLTLAVYLAGAVAAFVSSYRGLEDSREKEKLRWVVWGVGVSMLPTAVLVGLEMAAGIHAPWSDVWWPLLLLILPSVFAYAILSHRIMDIEIVLNRGLVYTIVTGIMLVIFIVLENLLAALSVELTGTTSFAFVMATAVAMAALLNPVKSRVEMVVERLFFAYRQQLREGLRDLAHELSFITQLERMEQLLVRRLVDLALARGAALFLREDEGGFALAETFEAPEDGGRDGRLSFPAPGFRFKADDGLVLWLMREGKPLSLETAGPEAERRLEPGEVRLLRGLDAAVALPLRVRGELTGFLLLSRRRNRELFDRDELALLHHLAPLAAADLTTARLRGRSRDLEHENAALREELLTRFRAASAPDAARGSVRERVADA
jgi:GAF domain-containing protein